jgi:hypothetical protein
MTNFPLLSQSLFTLVLNPHGFGFQTTRSTLLVHQKSQREGKVSKGFELTKTSDEHLDL